jgi:hypothetical protein
MVSTLIRHTFGLIWWLAVAAAIMAANVWAVIEHYLNAKNALELAGTERQPLYRDELIGRFLGSFIPDATLSHALALTVSLLEALGLFILFQELFTVIELARHRRQHQATQNAVEVSEANWQMLESLALMLVLGLLLFWGVRLDVELFRFRAIAGAGAIEDPSLAPSLPNWEHTWQENGDLFAVALAHFGAWGYVAFTAIGALILEWSFQKLGNRCTLLLAPIDRRVEEWLNPAPATADALFYGYDAEGQPVYDPEIPIAYDTDGTPLATAGAGGETPSMRPGGEARVAAPPPPPVDPPTPPAAPFAPNPPSPGPNGEEVDVIGGADGQRVRLAEARADESRYYIDPATGWVWDRRHWEALHGMGPAPEAEAA